MGRKKLTSYYLKVQTQTISYDYQYFRRFKLRDENKTMQMLSKTEADRTFLCLASDYLLSIIYSDLIKDIKQFS